MYMLPNREGGVCGGGAHIVRSSLMRRTVGSENEEKVKRGRRKRGRIERKQLGLVHLSPC